MSGRTENDGGRHDWADDPRLLAYALGETAELGAEDLAEIEAALDAEPACRAALDALEAVFPRIERALEGREVAAAAGPIAARAAAAPLFVDEAVDGAPGVEHAAALGRRETAARLSTEARDEIRRAAGSSRSRRPAWIAPLMAAGLLGVSGTALWVALDPNRGRWTRFGADSAAPEGEVMFEAAADAAPAARPSASRRVLLDGSRMDAPGKSATSGLESRSREWRPKLEIPHETAMVYRRGTLDGPSSKGSERFDDLRDELQSFARGMEKDSAGELRALGYAAGAEPVLERTVVDAPARDLSDDDGFEGGVRTEVLRSEEPVLELSDAEERVATEPPPAPENPFIDASVDPFSTFSIDVDTASYALARAELTAGRFPYPASIRVEEFVNYFSYDDAPPSAGADEPFAVRADVGAAPWAPEHRLVRIGVQAREVDLSEVGSANIVFLVDVSGSMNRPEKLPLVKKALATLTASLRPDDRVAIVVYASAQGLALPSTPVDAREAILQSLESLESGGSTNGGAGIELAYSVARDHFVEGGVNRVVLCTDGDFNVGVTGEGALEELIAREAADGIELSVLGFGTSRRGDGRMEALSNRGNGNYALVDSELEARRVLTEAVGGTLVTVAKDVKIQVAWNPARVAAFRLVGYENRMLEHEDFLDDTVDAGEIGSGHHVTALFEVVPVGAGTRLAVVGAPRLEGSLDAPDAGSDDGAVEAPAEGGRATGGEAAPAVPPAAFLGDGLLEVRLRHKRPGGDVSVGSAFAFDDAGGAGSDDLRFAAAVAAFAQKLRRSGEVAGVEYEDVRAWALGALGEDPGGLRAGFVRLVERACDLERAADEPPRRPR
ncbi:MAG: von Willebrand factor type A domain-containing protein [Planctomycetota bacterium]